MASVSEVVVHPVALFSIVDSYERRNEDSKRVIGTLLGSFKNGIVEVRNCFTVPHHETEEEVALEMDYAASMFELHKRACPGDEIVGWYATCADVSEQSVLIHEYYSRETNCPIHLTIDTTLKSGRMSVKAYVSSPMGVPGGTMGTIFTPVPCKITCYEPEAVAVSPRSGAKARKMNIQNKPANNLRNMSAKISSVTRILPVDHFVKGKGGSKKPVPLLSNIQHIVNSADKISDRLGKTLEYVNDVLNGKIPPDNEIGRHLMEIVGSVPQMDPSQLEKMMNSNMQDLLMVLYLASLTKTQLSIGTKLNSVISDK